MRFASRLILLFLLSISVNSNTLVASENIPPQANEFENVGLPLSRIFSPKEHGGHSQNWTSIHSKSGHVYVGHTNGISQWDGEYWRNLTTHQRSPVRAFSEWRDEIYFGTTNDLLRLKLNDSGRMQYESLLQSSALKDRNFGEIWSVASNERGVVFSATRHTFFYDGKAVYDVENAQPSKHKIFEVGGQFLFKPRHLSNIYQLAVTLDGPDLRFHTSALPIALPLAARVMEILPIDAQGLLIVTEEHGIFTYQNQQLVLRVGPDDLGVNTQFYDAIRANDGRYYVGTAHSGLYILSSDFSVLMHYQEQDNLGMNTVLSVKQDYQGNIWLTGIPNVVKMTAPNVISQFKAGTTSTEILRIKDTPFGMMITGNGSYLLQAQSGAYTPKAFGLIHPDLNASVDFEIDGQRMIKAGWGGIYALELNQDGSKAVKTTQLASVGLGRIIKEAEKQGDYFVSSSDGLFYLQHDLHSVNEWQVFQFPLPAEEFISLQVDGSDVWLGSSLGTVYIIKNATEAVQELRLRSSDEANHQWQQNLLKIDRSKGLGSGPVELFIVDNQVVISSAGELFEWQDDQLIQARHPIFSDPVFANADVIDRLIEVPASASFAKTIWYRVDGKSGLFAGDDKGNWHRHSHVFDAFTEGGMEALHVSDDAIAWFVRDKAEIYRVDLKAASQFPPVAPLNVSASDENETPLALRVIGGQENAGRLHLLKDIASKSSYIRIHFSSSNNAGSKPMMYRSRLIHADADNDKDEPWTSWTRETYRDIGFQGSGDFRFQIQARDPWARINTAEVTMHKLAPWYLSTLALISFTLFALVLISLFAWFIQRWRTKALLADNLALEEKVAMRTQEVNEKVEQLKQQQLLKDRFFGNVSHEFRTPLTLTIGPLELLLKEHKEQLSEDVNYLASTALNNANKMLALVGQVLDLNRLEAGKLPLRIGQYDLAELLRNTASRFESWASQQQQTISVFGCDEPLLAWFDLDQIEKCVSNLLSNAIKYSGEQTSIQVELHYQQDLIHIDVIDNGRGISKEAKDKVFERFYQDQHSQNISTPGTGIGLSLVKEIMLLHRGEACLMDTPDNCHFRLTLLRGHAHFDKSQMIDEVSIVNASIAHRSPQSLDTNSALTTISNDIQDGSKAGIDLTTLLIIDDNQELLTFMSLRLSASYRILQASNGEQGLAIALKELPDLIISDVNMPKMTGLELAKALKENQTTRTIPLILLTAKATKREIVEGFSVGADDYLTKPFDTSELIVRVNAQINARKLVRTTLQNEALNETEHRASFSGRFDQIVRQNFSDPRFSVEQLANKLNMSRDTLIRRCKKEMSNTPAKLLATARMAKAQALLQQGNLSISEVAYACGFESLAYFSNSFKKHFGHSPSDA
ncbi:response regulator [Aliiglaciecola sp. CAU 1673]|uniref:response regulator n=1 Tax=Aliiglaciecola sp. CAU 1673 TaxID=3032595 RepID=UPI0023DBBC40|nr:response regulator [Aliiglaciecola sp. CAU 1673]MDF2177066.1 response regulator [Aliiglaciecola sp. CAU 1673]